MSQVEASHKIHSPHLTPAVGERWLHRDGTPCLDCEVEITGRGCSCPNEECAGHPDGQAFVVRVVGGRNDGVIWAPRRWMLRPKEVDATSVPAPQPAGPPMGGQPAAAWTPQPGQPAVCVRDGKAAPVIPLEPCAGPFGGWFVMPLDGPYSKRFWCWAGDLRGPFDPDRPGQVVSVEVVDPAPSPASPRQGVDPEVDAKLDALVRARAELDRLSVAAQEAEAEDARAYIQALDILTERHPGRAYVHQGVCYLVEEASHQCGGPLGRGRLREIPVATLPGERTGPTVPTGGSESLVDLI